MAWQVTTPLIIYSSTASYIFDCHVGKPDMMVQKSESIRANCIWWKVGFSPAPILVYFLWHFSTCHIRIEVIWRTISHAKNTSQHVGSNMLYKVLLEKWQYHNYDIAFHIFQNAQVTSNKMVHKKRHHFLAQFSISKFTWCGLFCCEW